MSTADAMIHRGPSPKIEESKWEHFDHESALECQVALHPEESGFSAHCLNLPGVISQGDTKNEALENIADAFRETVLYYRGANEKTPWSEVEVPKVTGAKEYRILVRF